MPVLTVTHAQKPECRRRRAAPLCSINEDIFNMAPCFRTESWHACLLYAAPGGTGINDGADLFDATAASVTRTMRPLSVA